MMTKKTFFMGLISSVLLIGGTAQSAFADHGGHRGWYRQPYRTSTFVRSYHRPCRDRFIERRYYQPVVREYRAYDEPEPSWRLYWNSDGDVSVGLGW